jgi:type VI protein secretion system component VasK
MKNLEVQWSLDSSVDIVTKLQAEESKNSGKIPSKNKRTFSHFKCPSRLRS